MVWLFIVYEEPYRTIQDTALVDIVYGHSWFINCMKEILIKLMKKDVSETTKKQKINNVAGYNF